MNASTKIYANMLADTLGGRLDSERLRRIVEAKTVSDALKMLGDYGYSYRADGSIDNFIVAETNELIEFIKDTAADESVSDALIAEYAYNNVKLAYKSRFIDIADDTYYNVGLDIAKIKHGDYNELDPYLADALYELDSESEQKPQVIDLVITRAMYKFALSCGVPAVRKYFRTQIDLINILTAARLFRLGLSGRDEFIDGGTIDGDVLSDAAKGGGFSHCFMGTKYEEIAERLEKSEFKGLSEFARDSDDYLLAMTDSLIKDMGSYKPFLGYFIQARVELKTIKTALVCIKTDSRDLFYARRPEIFA